MEEQLSACPRASISGLLHNPEILCYHRIDQHNMSFYEAIGIFPKNI